MFLIVLFIAICKYNSTFNKKLKHIVKSKNENPLEIITHYESPNKLIYYDKLKSKEVIQLSLNYPNIFVPVILLDKVQKMLQEEEYSEDRFVKAFKLIVNELVHEDAWLTYPFSFEYNQQIEAIFG